MMDKAELTKAFLADSDTSCPACGYGLRGAESERCPECGAQFELRLGSDPKLGPWLVSVIAVVIPMGVCALSTISSALLDFGGVELVFIVMMPPIIGTAIYAMALWRLVRGRRKFWAKPRRDQVWSAIRYVLLTPLLAGVGFGLYMLVFFIAMMFAWAV